mmetsp:Transcript_12504/g.35110  ORF Transcript_12504/g.35110 Transcript_12504/m.35110 type:complete len:530 (-) Transcript_12504:261-1850(-)
MLACPGLALSMRTPSETSAAPPPLELRGSRSVDDMQSPVSPVSGGGSAMRPRGCFASLIRRCLPGGSSSASARRRNSLSLRASRSSSRRSALTDNQPHIGSGSGGRANESSCNVRDLAPARNKVVYTKDSTSTTSTLIPTDSRAAVDRGTVSEAGVTIRLQSYREATTPRGKALASPPMETAETPVSREVSSSDGSSSSGSARLIVVPPRIPSRRRSDPFQDSLWTKAQLGTVYVFPGPKVPGLLELFTSRDTPDFPKVSSWIARWYASEQGTSPDPVILPVVFHVPDIGTSGGARRPKSGLEQRRFTDRRQRYERAWEVSSHSDQTYNGAGSCIALNGEYISLRELTRRQKLGFIAPRSKSRGLLKVLLAGPHTAIITFEPLPQIQHMIGQLVATVAYVACGGRCTDCGHDASGADTFHNTVLDLQQVQMSKSAEDGRTFHATGINVSHPPGGQRQKHSVGLAIWINHGYVDPTPIAVGYCGITQLHPQQQHQETLLQPLPEGSSEQPAPGMPSRVTLEADEQEISTP